MVALEEMAKLGAMVAMVGAVEEWAPCTCPGHIFKEMEVTADGAQVVVVAQGAQAGGRLPSLGALGLLYPLLLI